MRPSIWRELRAAAAGRLSRLAAPFLIGLVAFFGVTGGRVLWPRNIAWITDGDARTYFLGWHFYRFSPWLWPLGLSPRYGDELSSAIFYVDNVPLLAMLFKAFSPLLSDPFQYFGFWLLGCFLLQAWFAWLLLGVLTPSRLLQACGATLFVLAPPFLYRFTGHYAMNGQWLILAALYICFGPRRLARGAAWPVLAFAACLIHSYITAMVLGLWLADLARRLLFEGRTRADFVQLLLVPGLVLLGVWQAGMFVMGPGMVKAGFGKYRMNLASLIDPSGWSYVLRDLPEGGGDYEGFNYLGLGVLALCLAALPALRAAPSALRRRREYWPLLALLCGLSAFAVSNRIGLAGATLEIPLPQGLIDRANALRASGRMFWPVFYVLLLLIVRAVLKRYPPKLAGSLLLGAVLLQAVDTSAGWLPIRRSMSPVGASWESPLKSPFWRDVPARYRRIHLVLAKNQKPGYEVFAYFAATNGMATDAVYTARVDAEKLREAQRRGRAAVNRGEYERDTLYVLDRQLVKAAKRSMREGDSLRRIDGYWIVAPGLGGVANEAD